jgi:xylan 1,4-beta-xylosidase
VKTEKGYAGILWNVDGDDYIRDITVPVEESTEEHNDISCSYTLVTKTVDEDCCNPLKLWHDLGEPAYPDNEQIKLIKSSADPLVQSDVIFTEESEAAIKIPVKKNGVVFFELKARNYTPDRGYDYDKVLNFH